MAGTGAATSRVPGASAESAVLVVWRSALQSLSPDLLGTAPVCLVIEAGTGAHGLTAPALQTLRAGIQGVGVESELLGWARSSRGPDVAVAVIRRDARPGPVAPPPGFRVLAAVPAFNEADVIVPCIRALLDQNIDVHLIDNWSTDGTDRMVTEVFGDWVMVERFPADGPTSVHQRGALLDRMAEIARDAGADWIINHDADERRRGPWPGLDLRAALYRVDSEGYNAVDHTVIDFPPIDDEFEPGSDFESHFTYFTPTETVANRIQIKAWKAPAIDLRSSGGHEAIFSGRRVHPFNFLVKHYPIRSQAHGERKVFTERKPRIMAEERRRRWHTHHDHMHPGHVFLQDPQDLLRAGDDFAERWLLERLYGFPTPGTIPSPLEPDMQYRRCSAGSTSSNPHGRSAVRTGWREVGRRADGAQKASASHCPSQP